MNALQMTQIERATGGQFDTVFDLPLDEQKALCELMKFDNFETWKQEVQKFLDENVIDDEDEEEGGYVLTAREALEEVPVYERYSYAGYLGRVYGGDMGNEEVLKHAGYSDDEIAELKFIEQDYYQNPTKYIK